jgi:hypothetical protein
VDAFEPGQICKDNQGADYDCGARAKQALEEIIGNQPVQCEPFKGQDRKFSRCSAGNVDLEVAIVRAGWAFPRRDFKPHDPTRFAELCGVENEAYEAKRGAWSGTFEIPFVQKHGAKEKVAFVSCPGFPVATAVVEPGEPSKSRGNADESENTEVSRWVEVLSALLAPRSKISSALSILSLVGPGPSPGDHITAPRSVIPILESIAHYGPLCARHGVLVGGSQKLTFSPRKLVSRDPRARAPKRGGTQSRYFGRSR